MKRYRAVCSHAGIFFAIIFVLTGAAWAADDSIALFTGPEIGTYYAFGRDIAQAGLKSNVLVNVISSQGSIDNIKRLNTVANPALAIVQSDVLGFLQRSQNADSQHMAANLRLVFPLYHEEVHILARKDIVDFMGLQGKRIAIGEEGSGNMLTSINLLSMMGVTAAETIKIPPAQGVVAVLKGEIDAAVFVSGKPVRMFKNLEDLTLPENQKYAAMLENVHFLPLDNPKMLEEYTPATITHADYSFVSEDIPTIAVQAVLISSDFSRSNKKRCDKLTTMARAIKNDLTGMREQGHPKWKEVTLDNSLSGWKKDSCASVASAAGNPVAAMDLIDIVSQER